MLQENGSPLPHLFGVNKRGACRLIIVPKEGVASMPNTLSLMGSSIAPDDCDFYLEEIVLKLGYGWLDVSSDVKMEIDFAEEDKPTNQGDLFTYNVPFPIPNDSHARGKIFRAYQGREWIVAHKQKTGTWRILGTMERGAVFTAALKTGTSQKNLNETECGFTWSCGERAYYSKSLVEGDWFEMRFDTSSYVDERIVVDETMYVTWGDGTSGVYACNTGSINSILKTYSGIGLKIARFYHLNKATFLHGEGIGDTNRNVTHVTGQLPKTLVELWLNNNDLVQLPSFSTLPKRLVDIDLSSNNLTDTYVMSNYLSTLVLNGVMNGYIDISGQSPTMTPSAGMLSSKVVLESRGWTVNF